MKKNCRGAQRAPQSGISLISLIVTIITIIILASIVIFNGLKTPDQAQFAKFAQEISDIQEHVEAQYNMRHGQLIRQGSSATDTEIYTWIAAGEAATSSGFKTVSVGTAASQYQASIPNVDANGNELIWQVKVVSASEKQIVEIDRENNNVGTSIPHYEDRTWKIKTDDGTVFIDPPLEYDGVKYATLADIQTGKQNPIVLADNSSLANAPVLTSGMIPVYHDGSVWRKADSSNNGSQKWYDYSADAKQWANMVTVKSSARGKYESASAGKEIEEGDVIGYWVWIPRYAYKVNGNSFDIVFLSGITNNYGAGDASEGGYTVHPVFTNDSTNSYSNGGWDKELKGIWVAKFEASSSTTEMLDDTTDEGAYTPAYAGTGKFYATGTGKKSSTIAGKYGNNGTGSVRILPNVTSWRYISTSAIRSKSLDVSSQHGLSSSGVDSHMMKNTEWGAVAYLAYSAYGSSNVWNNSYYEGEVANRTTFASGYDTMTGMVCQNGADDSTPYTYEKTGKAYDEANGKITIKYKNISNNAPTGNEVTKVFYRYNTTMGMHGSTTGNIYGVYDMTGGAWEYMAAYVDNGQQTGNTTSVFGKDANKYNKYVNVYQKGTSDTGQANYEANANWKGDAVHETSTAGTGSTSWNGDYSYFPYSTSPVFVRGGNFYNGGYAGVFAFSILSGYADYSCGFRVVLVP